MSNLRLLGVSPSQHLFRRLLAIGPRLLLVALFVLRWGAPAYAGAYSAIETEAPGNSADEPSARRDQEEPPQDWGLHAQTTIVYQAHRSFRSPYEGPNGLTSSFQGKETWDLTLYAGLASGFTRNSDRDVVTRTALGSAGLWVAFRRRQWVAETTLCQGRRT